MSLLNRLRPKWQHSDPDVRVDAVRRLDKGEVELLTAVAQQDDDARVRKLAIKKLDTPRVLLEIAESDSDPSVRATASQRATQLLIQIACDVRDLDESKRALELLSNAVDVAAVADKAHFEEIRESAFESLKGDAALETFVRKAKDPTLRLKALAGIQSPDALKNVVLDDSVGELAATALARIDDVVILEGIAEHGGAPKPIRRQAFSKLTKLVPDDHPIKAKQREDEYASLCERVEGIEPLDQRALERLAPLESEWSELQASGAASDDLTQRYTAALERVRAARVEKKPVTGAVTEPAPPLAAPAEASVDAASMESREHLELVEGLERTVAKLGPTRSLEDEALEGAIQGARERWVELGENAALEKRFQTALAKASARIEQFTKLRQRKEELTTLLVEAETASKGDDPERAARALSALSKKWRTLESVADADANARFAHLEERAHELQESARREQAALEQKTLSDIQQCVATLSALSASDDLSIRDADKALRSAQDLLKNMGPLARSVNRKKVRRDVTDAREKLFKKVQDTRTIEDWKRWANVDIQLGLITKMEALRASKDTPKIAKEMRAIHEEWKKAGAAPAEKADELWQRYKSSREELKARCDEFFAKQNQQRRENLKLKEALCVEVEALSESEDWNKTADAIKALQEKWKTIGPPPQKQSDAVWKRFRKACDHFFERRKSHFGELKGERDENLAKKEALCEKAEALQSSTEWSSTVDELKRLQAEWRTIGAVPRNKSDLVWKRFRKACDYFFDRYKRRDDVELEELIKQREAVADEAAAFASQPSEDPAELARKTKELWSTWKRLGAIPESKRDIHERFEKNIAVIVSKTVDAAPDAFADSDLDPATSRKKRERIVKRLESLVSTFTPSEAHEKKGDALEELARRLKDALASNTMTGGKPPERNQDWRAALQEVKRLQSTWMSSPPVPGDQGVALNERFQTAYENFQAHKPQS